MAQTDTEFWLTVPNEWSNIQSSYLHVFTYDQSAVVTVSLPAADFQYPPFVDTLSAESSLSLSLRYEWSGRNIGTIPDIINNLGILITSTAPISCYLDYLHPSGDITTLKGRHALGTDFVVPMQNMLDSYTNGYDREHIQVVATEDSTVVQMTPPPGHAFSGLGIDEPATVTLNRGQSYAREAAGITAQDRLGGTIIHASHPIAVCFADYDLMLPGSNNSWQPGGTYNVTGDQILPIDKTGTRYVVLRSKDAVSDTCEQVWVYPTHLDDTVMVYFNGFFHDTIHRQHNGPLFLEDSATLITLDKPAVVLQLTSLASFFGGAGTTMLPPIDCTGTHRVSYFRNSHNTALQILTKRAFVSDFLFNRDSTFITANDFHTLPADTTLAWCYKKIATPVVNHQYLLDSLITIENSSGTFHLSVLEHRGGFANESDTTYAYDCVFGYYYDYNQPSYIRLTLDSAYCRGDSIVFTYDAPFIEGMELRGPNGLHLTQPPFVLYNIDSNASGRYYLEGFDTTSCHQVRTDSIDIVVKGGHIGFGMDSLFCTGDSIHFDYTASTNVIGVRLHCPNGLVLESPPFLFSDIDTSMSGIYWLEGTDTGECQITVTDSIYIHIYNNIDVQLFDTVTENGLPWHRYDTLFNTDADTIFIVSSPASCDSIIHYHLKVYYKVEDTIIYYACESDLPVQYDDSLFYQEGQGLFHYTGSHGEDSLVTFILHVIPSSDTTICDSIAEDQLPWFFFDTLFNDTVANYIFHTFNEAGCDSIIHYSLFIFWNGDHCDTALSYPNVVTPNGDGANDRFVIGGLIENNCFKYNELTIYDRYGHCVYHKRNIATEDDWWNPAAQRAPSGTYFYYFKAHGVNIWTQHRGVIEVLRDK